MTKRKIVQTDLAPKAIGPYEQAIWANDTLYISGQIPLNVNGKSIIGKKIEAETKQVMKNIKDILKSQGLEIEHLVKCSIFIKSMKHFDKINEIYASFFHSKYPAREIVEVSDLPKKAAIEIAAIAFR